MTASNQENDVSKARNHAVVSVIAGLNADEAEAISAAIIHAKNHHAPNARGTIATGQEQNISRMLGNGQDAAFSPKTKKKKKKKNKKSSKSGKNKSTTKNKNKNKPTDTKSKG